MSNDTTNMNGFRQILCVQQSATAFREGHAFSPSFHNRLPKAPQNRNFAQSHHESKNRGRPDMHPTITMTLRLVVGLSLCLGFAHVAHSQCDPVPSGLVSWWRAEGCNAIDIVGGNNGTLENGVTCVPGEVGQAFNFSADQQMIVVGNPPNLQLQNFTIEAWIQRASATVASSDPTAPTPLLFGYGHGGYGLGMFPGGELFLTQVDFGNVDATVGVTDTAWHHVAVTTSGGTVAFYIDGVEYPAAGSYNPVYQFTTSAAIGGRADNLGGNGNASFLGAIDEMSVYSRALAPAELAAIYAAGGAGKCTAFPLVSATMPTNGATQVATNSMIIATFTKPMNPATLNTNTFQVRDANNNLLAGAITYVDSILIAVFSPAQPLAANSAYMATITTGAAAANGSYLPGNYSWEFSTSGNSVFIFNSTSIGAGNTDYDKKDLVVANGVLTISGGNHPFSSVFVSARGSLVLSGGTIQGCPITAANGASLIVTGSGNLDGVTVNGVLDVGNTYSDANLTVTNGLV